MIGTGVVRADEPTIEVEGDIWADNFLQWSDRNAKTDFRKIDPVRILEKLLSVPITMWKFKRGNPDIDHIGPMAQDFYAAFSLGEDDRHIGTVDASGVALAAIQGLYAMVKEKDQLISSQQEQIERMEARLKALEALIKQR